MNTPFRIFPALIGIALLSTIHSTSCAENATGPRVALVIGNSRYQKLPELGNCVHDAQLMMETFHKLGIRVHGGKPLTDLTADQMDKAINEFTAAIGPDTEAFVYFSGHGVQVDGQNYLLPVDFKAEYQSQVKRQAIALDSVLTLLEGSRAKLRVIILDSCRDPGQFLPGEPATKGIGRAKGLAEQRVESPETLVCFATKHGTPAFSSNDAAYSFYTGVLAEEMLKPGRVEDILKVVARRVYEKTEQKQLPFTYGSLLNDHFFMEGTVLQPVIAKVPSSAPMITTLESESTPIASFSSSKSGNASAFGLNTAVWSKPSEAMKTQVQHLETAIKLVGKQENVDEIQKAIDDASAEIKKLAVAGDKDAQFAMGLLLSSQQGQIEKVVEYYTAAAGKGQLQAMNNLGYITAASSREPEKQKEGIALIKKASAGGLNAARRNMAQIYLRGMLGEPCDANAAEQLLVTASGEGDADATYMLSQLYLGAAGSEKQNGAKGFELLKKAAENGSATALDTMGALYQQGGRVEGKANSKSEKDGAIVVKPDPRAAIALFEKLAKANNPIGLRKMGGIYEQGVKGVVTKDLQKAVEYYIKAAQGNDAPAQFRLGSMYDTGVQLDPKSDRIEIAPNASVALIYYKLAAQNNLGLASYNVGIFYEQGRGIDKDIPKAFTFYLQAAQAGVGLGMQKVAIFCYKGMGTTRDLVAAKFWFDKAATTGEPESEDTKKIRSSFFRELKSGERTNNPLQKN